jgi:hypothetical protein
MKHIDQFMMTAQNDLAKAKTPEEHKKTYDRFLERFRQKTRFLSGLPTITTTVPELRDAERLQVGKTHDLVGEVVHEGKHPGEFVQPPRWREGMFKNRKPKRR